jgi:amino acid transporter
MTEAARDAGLIRSVGPFGLAAATINIIIGAGIFALPGVIAAAIGVYAPLAFVACAIAMGAVAFCFAEGGRRIATSGGCYGYIGAAFGPQTAFITGLVFIVANCLATAGIAAALASVIAAICPPGFAAFVRPVVIIGVIGLLSTVNVRGVIAGTRLVVFMTVVKLVPLVVFVVAGLPLVHGSNLAPSASPSFGDVGRAVILGVFAFTGMEAPLSASGEVRDPGRSIPLALLVTMIVVTALYVAVQVVAQGVRGPALAGSATPLADAMSQVHPALRTLLLAGAAVSMFGWLGSDLMSSPRMLFALGRDGLLPRALGRLHPTTRAPYVAILWYALAAVVIALSGTFAELAVLATLGSAAIYMTGCLAVWRLGRGPLSETATAGKVSTWLGAAVILGVIGMGLTIALASAAEIGGLIALIVMCFFGYRIRGAGRAT